MTPDEFRKLLTVAPGGCLEWSLRRDKQGYGRLYFDGRAEEGAHRVAYRLFVAPIPPGMTVDHLCFNTSCANPDHLRLLTHTDNSKNQRSALATHCIHGHEFTPDNTYIKPGFRNGRRQCRTCQRAAVTRYKQRNAA